MQQKTRQANRTAGFEVSEMDEQSVGAVQTRFYD
jgi:hypothetical protein